MPYFKREIETKLSELSKYYSVITITGPRQSGKTTLVKHFYQNLDYINFENPDTRLFAKTDPRAFLSQIPKGAILDEIQYVPELFSYIQAIVDADKTVKFVLTGSSNFKLLESISQSLAGRTAVINLLPLSINELKNAGIDLSTNQYMLNGFYPNIHFGKRPFENEYNFYIQTYIERDVRQLINIVNQTQFQLFLKICAGRIGNLFNASAISNEIGISVPTIKSWISILETSFIVYFLPPWYKNKGKRLIKTPKLYFYDVGLACSLLGIFNENQLVRDPLRGALFENMVISEFVKNRFNNVKQLNLYFYRDSHQNEIDLVDEQGIINLYEIKSSQTYNPDFVKKLQKNSQFFSNKKSISVIYDGEMQIKSEGYNLLNYKNVFIENNNPSKDREK